MYTLKFMYVPPIDNLIVQDIKLFSKYILIKCKPVMFGYTNTTKQYIAFWVVMYEEIAIAWRSPFFI